MQNIFIITLGTREVQFKKDLLKEAGFEIPEEDRDMLKHPASEIPLFKVERNYNYPDYLCCYEPRTAGEIIIHNWDMFHKVVELPLIDNAYETILKDEPIDQLILVYTDQHDLDLSNHQHKRNFTRDTVHFREIIRKHLSTKSSVSSDDPGFDIAVEKKATDIDFQYKDFSVKCKSLFENKADIHQIFLLAQGGIDQINHALTLQLIQAFGSRVKLWQQAEGDLPRNLEFPFLFIRDLNKQKILKHLEDYDFGLISEFSDYLSQDAIDLAKYASSRLNLDYSHPTNDYINEIINAETKCRDLYICAKIFFKRGDYGNYLWRLFTLLENIYRYKCDRILGNTEKYFKHNAIENHEWEKVLKSVDGLYEFLSSNKRRSLKLNNPNRLVYKYIYNFLCHNHRLEDNRDFIQALNTVYNLSEKLLSEQRNNIAHYLKPISKLIIEDSLGGKSCEDLNSNLDFIFGLNKERGFGIFDEIRERLLNLL
jgi:hypothetical protein